jgi:DNA primase small subunit
VNQKVIQAALEDIILQYTYPRLDAEVSKHRNHLLKAPFCIHPKTARVCVPVDPSKIDEFDPGSVPTVGELLAELDKAGGMEVDEEGGARAGELGLYIYIHSTELISAVDWEKTSLRPYVEMMERHALGLMNETRLAKRAAGKFTQAMQSTPHVTDTPCPGDMNW